MITIIKENLFIFLMIIFIVVFIGVIYFFIFNMNKPYVSEQEIKSMNNLNEYYDKLEIDNVYRNFFKILLNIEYNNFKLDITDIINVNDIKLNNYFKSYFLKKYNKDNIRKILKFLKKEQYFLLKYTNEEIDMYKYNIILENEKHPILKKNFNNKNIFHFIKLYIDNFFIPEIEFFDINIDNFLNQEILINNKLNNNYIFNLIFYTKHILNNSKLIENDEKNDDINKSSEYMILEKEYKKLLNIYNKTYNQTIFLYFVCMLLTISYEKFEFVDNEILNGFFEKEKNLELDFDNNSVFTLYFIINLYKNNFKINISQKHGFLKREVYDVSKKNVLFLDNGYLNNSEPNYIFLYQNLINNIFLSKFYNDINLKSQLTALLSVYSIKFKNFNFFVFNMSNNKNIDILQKLYDIYKIFDEKNEEFEKILYNAINKKYEDKSINIIKSVGIINCSYLNFSFIYRVPTNNTKYLNLNLSKILFTNKKPYVFNKDRIYLGEFIKYENNYIKKNNNIKCEWCVIEKIKSFYGIVYSKIIIENTIEYRELILTFPKGIIIFYFGIKLYEHNLLLKYKEEDDNDEFKTELFDNAEIYNKDFIIVKDKKDIMISKTLYKTNIYIYDVSIYKDMCKINFKIDKKTIKFLCNNKMIDYKLSYTE